MMLTSLARASIALLVAACASTTGPPEPAPAPTLTPLELGAEVRAVKSSGKVIDIRGTTLHVRVDPGNGGLTLPLNNALIALRTSAETQYARNEQRTDAGPVPTVSSDVRVGDRITFNFEPASFDPADHSYLARVIGR